MPKVAVYNSKGETQSSIELSDLVFGVSPNQDLIHQVYTAQSANARLPWAHTKTKGEVRGGGRKPWQQKGTGRARHGSIRSPIWKGGGITFGPRNDRNYTQKINKKMNRLAVIMCLSDKVASDMFLVVSEFSQSGKTRDIASLRAALPGSGKSTLIITKTGDIKTRLAARNIQMIDLVTAPNLNVSDLMNHQFVLVSPDAISILEERLSKKQV